MIVGRGQPTLLINACLVWPRDRPSTGLGSTSPRRPGRHSLGRQQAAQLQPGLLGVQGMPGIRRLCAPRTRTC